ncbi:hypothetical protein [Rhodopirellula baltica]|uniref:Uncharacterized protein n=1 Tax=Rhodopirellula baltica (strain DSM 10527 / NCIMB 13988 / SH1) TaxID=243090 RepID=Q7UU21_RHOBA|nr:hypothetical protein [Rhodopirellula baltica]CAD73263.1 hypothetical protein-signal peptide and transmembrane prediction [Rhodopirellula baltica SH 1]
MIRLLSVPALLLLACALSGVYGMVHNQVSYSISSEYFTKFKFDQFDISQSVSERLGAAIVGWHASWWMGAFIGLFLVPAGMLVRSDLGYVLTVLRAFSVVLATTILVGMIGLLLAIAFTKADPVVDTMLRDALIDDPVAFRRTAALHNASYIGGLLGIFAGLVSVFKAFLQENDRLNFRPREVEE